VDLLAVQRSLSGLEERFSELHEKAEARLSALASERDLHLKEKEDALRQISELNEQLENASNETELALNQLSQVQKELEHYFLVSRKQAVILKNSDGLVKRASELVAQLI